MRFCPMLAIAVAMGLPALPVAACETAGSSAPETLTPPVPGPLFSGYGLRLHPLLGILKMHDGVDFEASIGEPVVAAASGRVVAAGRDGAYGIAVLVQHGGGLETLSAHLLRTAVDIGDCVGAGSVIGQSGTTGLTERPKVHFEVRAGGLTVDPAPLLAADR